MPRTYKRREGALPRIREPGLVPLSLGQVRVTPDLLEAVRATAAARGVTLAQVVRDALAEYASGAASSYSLHATHDGRTWTAARGLTLPEARQALMEASAGPWDSAAIVDARGREVEP